jgi:hypothetical protein
MDQMGSQLAGMLMQSPVYEAYSRVCVAQEPRIAHSRARAVV